MQDLAAGGLPCITNIFKLFKRRTLWITQTKKVQPGATQFMLRWRVIRSTGNDGIAAVCDGTLTEPDALI